MAGYVEGFVFRYVSEGEKEKKEKREKERWKEHKRRNVQVKKQQGQEQISGRGVTKGIRIRCAKRGEARAKESRTNTSNKE